MNMREFDDQHMLFGMVFALGNRLQAMGDQFYEEITSKQWFFLIGLSIFVDDPTINELASVIGSSHQNIKQIALKLEKNGFVKLYTDPKDKRKLRIQKTEKCEDLGMKYQERELAFMSSLYEGIDVSALRTSVITLQKMEENIQKMNQENVTNKEKGDSE